MANRAPGLYAAGCLAADVSSVMVHFRFREEKAPLLRLMRVLHSTRPIVFRNARI